jgi:hypothetical protein
MQDKQAGKGDRPRKVDGDKYRDMYDQIFSKEKKVYSLGTDAPLEKAVDRYLKRCGIQQWPCYYDLYTTQCPTGRHIIVNKPIIHKLMYGKYEITWELVEDHYKHYNLCTKCLQKIQKKDQK